MFYDSMLTIDLMCKDITEMYNDLDWDMTEAVVEIRELAVESAGQAIREDKKAVLLAWEAVNLIEKTANQEGLLALEDKLEHFQRVKVPFYEVLELMIRMLVDGMDHQFILEVMTNDFYTRVQNAVTRLVFCLYMSCVQDIEENYRAYREAEKAALEHSGENITFFPRTAAFASDGMRRRLELIPEEYREEFSNNSFL